MCILFRILEISNWPLINSTNWTFFIRTNQWFLGSTIYPIWFFFSIMITKEFPFHPLLQWNSIFFIGCSRILFLKEKTKNVIQIFSQPKAIFFENRYAVKKKTKKKRQQQIKVHPSTVHASKKKASASLSASPQTYAIKKKNNNEIFEVTVSISILEYNKL